MPGLSIPDDFPLPALIGQEATQVCIGMGQVQLHFCSPVPNSVPQRWQPGARVDVEAGYELQVPGRQPSFVQNKELAKHGGELAELLSDPIAAVSRLTQNELELVFASGAKLRLLTDAQGFESYHLHVSGESVDVTKPA